MKNKEEIFKTIPYEILGYDELVEHMKEKGMTNFVDPDFPPSDLSLYNPLSEPYPYNFVVQWRRPHEFMEEPKLFEDNTDPNDIKQGRLGD